ncbi:YrdB family protein [Kribbella catacumbae]|uniref:YrdB family protein n=1 Tax=Kribbella catacumbae TaxID=460086 RepID=UPI00037118F5|nr:YrdB family protein [Kribbella catacumbae]
MFEIWRWSNLGLAFLMELAGLAIYSWWGWNAGSSTALRLVLAIGLPVIAAVLWGLFAAPTSKHGGQIFTAAFKLTCFALAALAVWSLDHHVLAGAFVLVVAANVLIIRAGRLASTTEH